MNEESCKAILAEWRGGGLEGCLAGKEDNAPVFILPSPSRVAQWRKSGTSPRWTAHEDEVMNARYFAEGCSNLLSALPGRSKEAIFTRAKRLGVQRERLGVQRGGRLA